MSFIIHGATGAQGAPVLARLMAAGHAARAAVRHTAALGDMPSVAIDNASVESLAAAYRGASGVFVHLPLGDEGQRLQFAKNIAQAVVQARPGRVVISTSGWIVDEPGSPLQQGPDSAIATLIRLTQASGVPTAVVAPRLFLENLLIPVVLASARAEGVLRYPLRADFPVSWSSHLDVAEVAVRLLTDTAVQGTVGVGHQPGLTGDELAASLSRHLGRDVRFEAITPSAFGDLLAPLFGAANAAGVAVVYEGLALMQANLIAPATSAQTQLGLAPRTVLQWLQDVKV